jgi:uncharacterized repeat protein (TIGR03803 family)
MNRLFYPALLASALGVSCISGASAGVKILHRFNGSDGTHAPIALTVGPDGHLYGGTIEGGKFNRGTVFSVDPATGKFRTLHNFSESEGLSPFGQLLLASDGYLYGTTRSGGDDNVNCYQGCGTIYRISPTGRFKTLHFMTLQEGATLQGGLIESPDGRFYSTATQGGVTGCGTIYAFSSATSKVKVLHNFNCDNEGRFPYGRLVLATNGFFYGTTSEGAFAEEGTVYRMKPDGSAFQTLLEFGHFDAGCQPKAGLIQASNGDLYGAAEDCGNYGSGALYAVTMDGAIRAIHHFDNDGYARDGKNSTAELLQAPDGKLYGTAPIGGLPVEDPDRSGTIFRIRLDGTKFRLLHTFMQAPDGSFPTSGLTVGPDGNLYGVTPAGGREPWPGDGTVYRLTIRK